MPLRLFLILIVCLVSRLSVAGWTKVGQFNGQYFCGYFFNEKLGLIGGGDDSNFPNIIIRRTTDGGKNWTTCTLPNGSGYISSIFMVDSMVGYASAMSRDFSVLKTVDGGKSWKNFTNDGNGTTPCVYATSRAVIRTKWSGPDGGVSLNNGQTYSRTFSGESNGIAFLDDLRGVVTMGPQSSLSTYYTTDGGLSWSRGGQMRESWGVYADKTTQSFIALAEDGTSNPGDVVYRSTDMGRSWNMGNPYYNFPGTSTEFTGHIAGVGATVYVQSADQPNGSAFFRSDDGGRSWRNVGGYSNDRDTRFFVTGCRGEIVYAFDKTGGVWKTTDGGDGTLVPSPYIASVPMAGAGEKVLIPVTYDTLQRGSIVQEISGTLQLNDNLIQPDSLFFKGTQLDSVTTFDTVYKTSAGWFFDVKLKKNIVINGSSSAPLLYVSAHTYLTDTTESEVALQTISFTIASKATTLSTCTIQSAVFKLQLSCGDSTLIKAMKGEQLNPFFAIRPNPSQGHIILSSSLPISSTITASLNNLNGVAIKSFTIEAPAGSSEKDLHLNGVAPGEYILSLQTNQGTVRHLKMVIER